MFGGSNLTEKSPLGRLFVFSLGLAYFATVTLDVLVSLLLIDIASTFEVTLGVASQISTFSGIVAITTGLIMGLLSVRFRHKSLVIAGLLFMVFSALGCFLAPNLNVVFLFYPLQAVAAVMILATSLAMIGDYLPSDRKTKTVGLFLAAAPLANIVAIIVTGFLAGLGGWRYVPLFFSLPASVIALFFAWFCIPSIPNHRSILVTKGTYLLRFKDVLFNRSAGACLLGNILRTTAYLAIITFGISFYRQQFLITTDQAILIMLGGTLFFTFGNFAAGRLPLRFGRKHIAVTASFFAGMSIITVFQMPSFWMALPFDYLGLCLSGIANTAATSLTLDQVPESRGTLVSLNTTSISIGMVLAPAIGGMLLDAFSFKAMGLTLGTAGILAATVFYFLTQDPNKRA
jgi:predicted MFS family arabinose efflux permease